MRRITIGFIPLTDAAPLIAAHERGFAAAEGLAFDLVREVSWANIRDKLSVGLFDAAHMLTPLALASALGIGHIKVPLIAPVTLALNGNAITLSTAFVHEIGGLPEDPVAALPPIAAAIRRRESAGLSPPVFASTFPFSTHNYLLRAYLAAGGIDPDRDVQLVVIPPPLMAGSLEKGLIDGFCVGSPWNSVAVDRGAGHILAPSSALFSRIPEKTLAIGDALATSDPETLRAVIAATVRGAAWCADPGNALELAAMLSAPHYLGVAAPLVLRTIEGRLIFTPGGPSHAVPDFIRYDVPGATRPDAGRYAWLYAQAVRWGQTRFDPAAAARIGALIRTDLYDAAVPGALPVPVADPVGSILEPAIDPADLAGYLARFDARGLPTSAA